MERHNKDLSPLDTELAAMRRKAEEEHAGKYPTGYSGIPR